MNAIHLMPSDVHQKLALMNAAPELRDALEGLLTLARETRDGLLSQRVTSEDRTVGDELMNKHIIRLAAIWTAAIDEGDKAVLLSKGGAR